MSEYHVLNDPPEGNNLRVVVHTTVPVGTNSAQPTAVEWADAIVGNAVTPITSQVPDLDPVLHGLTTGTIVETIIRVPDDRNASNRLTQLKTDTAAEQARVAADLQVVFKYWGAEGDVP